MKKFLGIALIVIGFGISGNCSTGDFAVGDYVALRQGWESYTYRNGIEFPGLNDFNHLVVPGVFRVLKIANRPTTGDKTALLVHQVRDWYSGPEGCDENGPAPGVAPRSRIDSDMLPRRALPASHFDRNAAIPATDLVH
jgi:hypothetical protein